MGSWGHLLLQQHISTLERLEKNHSEGFWKVLPSAQSMESQQQHQCSGKQPAKEGQEHWDRAGGHVLSQMSDAQGHPCQHWPHQHYQNGMKLFATISQHSLPAGVHFFLFGKVFLPLYRQLKCLDLFLSFLPLLLAFLSCLPSDIL